MVESFVYDIMVRTSDLWLDFVAEQAVQLLGFDVSYLTTVPRISYPKKPGRSSIMNGGLKMIYVRYLTTH